MVPKKGLLLFPRRSFSWLKEIYPSHPWSWEILGQSWGDYYLQGFQALGTQQIRVLSDIEAPASLPENVQWKHSFMEGNALEQLKDNRLYWKESPTFVVRAPFFYFDFWDKDILDLPSPLQFSNSLPPDPSIPFVLTDSHSLAPINWSSMGVFSMEDYFFLSQILLKGSVPRHLAGQSDLKGGVFYHPQTKIPSKTELRGGVYIGPKTQIGKDCQISRSLLYGHQILGARVVLDNKILVSNRILSPMRGTHSLIDDPAILKSKK